MSVFSARDADRSPMGLIGSQANVAHGGRADSVYTEPRREALGWDLALEQSLPHGPEECIFRSCL